MSNAKALVIGSGFGGLAAAIRLGARGYQVTVLEKLPQIGGRARVFEQDGFVFDAGPTVVTAPFLFDELWELAGKTLADDVDMRPVSPFYRIFFSDRQYFDYQGDAEAMRAEIARFSPSDVEGYERFLEMSEEIFKVGFEKLGHVPFSNGKDMARIAPVMMKLQSFRSVYGLVSRFIKDERLRTVLSFHPLLVGGNPFTTTSIYALIAYLERKWGVHFPMGGTGVLVRGLAGLIEGQGGVIRTECEVDEILVRGRTAVGVRLRGGEEIHADVVVSNADVAWTYKNLVPARYRKRWTDKKLERARYSMSLFVWYFGTDRKYDAVKHHTILLGPRYKGLLDDIFKNKVLARDFSLYLHRPTATDPTLAPEGCDAFYVLSPVPHMDSGVNWKVRAEPYKAAICKALEDTVLPNLSKHVVSERMLTPFEFKHELNSVRGAAFSLEPVLSQSAYFRPHNASEELERLYIVGAGTHPGAGLPGVLSSARVLDRVVPHADSLKSGAL